MDGDHLRKMKQYFNESLKELQRKNEQIDKLKDSDDDADAMRSMRFRKQINNLTTDIRTWQKFIEHEIRVEPENFYRVKIIHPITGHKISYMTVSGKTKVEGKREWIRKTVLEIVKWYNGEDTLILVY